MAKLNFIEFGIPYYEANVWIKGGAGDPLLLEAFTTKKEAVSCVKRFVKNYRGGYALERYVNHFDEDGCWNDSWDV